MRMNQTVYRTPLFRVLSDDQIERIYYAALDVLEDTGCLIHHEEALDLLKKNGAVVDGNRVRIPISLVERALGNNPRKMTLKGRNGKRSLPLQKDNVAFGTGSDQPFIYDRETGERRRGAYKDVYAAAKFVDYLSNYDFFMSHGLVSDVPNDQTYDRRQFMAMIEGCTKPFVITSVDREGLEDQYKMACMIQGGEEEFKLNPLFVVYIEPISPLKNAHAAVDKLMFSAEKGIPAMYTPCPSCGATSSASIAGMIVQSLAESLVAVVLSYLKQPGMPLLIGGVLTVMDMMKSTYSYGSPELSLALAGYTDVAKWLGLLMFSTGGCTDAKIVDEQAAAESATSLFYAMLSGANLVHDVGYTDHGLNSSLEALVMNQEIIGMVKQFGKGISTEDDYLALDVIDEVGPAGNFVAHDHTYEHWKEWFLPKLQDRSDWETWVENGSKTMRDRVDEETERILKEYEPEPIEEKLHKELWDMVEAADKRHS